MLRETLLKPIIVTLLVSGLTIGLNANAADVMTAPAHPGGKAIVAKTPEEHKQAAEHQGKMVEHHKATATHHDSIAEEHKKLGHHKLHKHHKALAKHHNDLAKEHEETMKTHKTSPDQ